MNHLRFLLIFVLGISQAGCFTPKLWHNTDAASYIEVPPSKISIKELESKNIKYWKAPKSGKIYIEQNSLQKLKNWTVRMFAAPVTVTLDAMVITVAAVVCMIRESAEEYHENWEKPETVNPGTLWHK